MSKRSAAVKREVSSPDTMGDEGRSKRRRVPTSRFDFQFMDNEEQRYLQQAIKISKIDKKREEMSLDIAPTYHPTLEEFADCMAYITKIRPEAERYGICKIVPPEGWNPPNLINMNSNKRFETKRQKVNTLQEGQGFDDGGQYTAATYKQMADAFYDSWIHENYTSQDRSLPSEEDVEKKYWDVVETSASQVTVDYGNDIDSTNYGSGFLTGGNRSLMAKYIRNPDFGDSEYYRQSTWNLNNVPSAPGSVLTYVKTPINGINVPWLYFGMLFASFCWHNEDNYFYSINYNHMGAAKQWYGVPGSAADLFEKVSKEFLLGLFRETPDLLHHMTTQISPRLLKASGVPVYKSTQEAGSFIVTFPKAFHCGFSFGFNCAEAVNFATSDWIPSGAEAEERYRLFGRESVFSYQRLLFTLLQNVADMKVGVRSLISETRRILNEEIELRTFALDKGIKDLSQLVAIPPNDFSTIDEKATEYDDMRTCGVCHQVCVLSAVGCECDMKRVACLRHFLSICKCAHEKKFLIEWAPRDQLHRMKSIEVSKTKINEK